MVPPSSGATGAHIGSGDWDISAYWQAVHGVAPTGEQLSDMNSFPDALSPGSSVPSRYDVYRYEIDQGLVGDTSASGESGLPQCATAEPVAGRRLLYAAIVDCLANAQGGATDLPVNSYASIFLTRPMVMDKALNAYTIDVEIVDISGQGGNGSLDTFVRDEAVLVR